VLPTQCDTSLVLGRLLLFVHQGLLALIAVRGASRGAEGTCRHHHHHHQIMVRRGPVVLRSTHKELSAVLIHAMQRTLVPVRGVMGNVWLSQSSLSYTNYQFVRHVSWSQLNFEQHLRESGMSMTLGAVDVQDSLNMPLNNHMPQSGHITTSVTRLGYELSMTGISQQSLRVTPQHHVPMCALFTYTDGQAVGQR
jgi:hypothetical protein